MNERKFRLGQWFSRPSIHLLTLALLVFSAGAAAAQQTLAYVVDQFGMTYAVDTATNAVVATAPAGGGPGVTATPNGAYVYVADSAGNTVHVISVASNTVIANVPIAAPRRIAFTPNGAFAYVTSTALDKNGVAEVSVIDTARLKVVATIPVAQGLEGLAVTPDGASVWVTSEGTELFIIDTATNTLAASVTPGGGGLYNGLAVTPNGALVYVSSAGSGEVFAISTATHAVVATFPGLFAFDLAVTPDGAFVYVPALVNDVAVIDTATNTVAATVPVGGNPAFVAIAPNGASAYIADLDGQVRAIDTASNTLSSSATVGIALGGIAVLVKPVSPTTKEQCRNGDWATFANPSFKNQGDCIAYVNSL